MRYSGYQNILSKVRYDYDSFDKDLSIIMIMLSGVDYILLLRKFINNSARCSTYTAGRFCKYGRTHESRISEGRIRGWTKLLCRNHLERLCVVGLLLDCLTGTRQNAETLK